LAPKKGTQNHRFIPTPPAGTKFGKWEVLSEAPTTKIQRHLYCRCECGRMKPINFATLRRGASTGCSGCALAERNYKHGLASRHKKTREYKIWCAVSTRAKERGLEFTIKPSDIVIPDVCPALGIPLISSGGHGFKDNLPSVDRLDSSKGYTPENIAIISWKANRLKSDHTVETLEKIAAYMRNHFSPAYRAKDAAVI